MHRFYVPAEDIHSNKAVVTGDEYRHLAKVLRLSAGDAVIVLDGQGLEYAGVIENLDREGAVVILGQPVLNPRESPLEAWLIQGLPKGEKMEWVIQKATELGVRGLIPLETGRSVVKLAGKKKQERQERWQKVALEAAKQCRRALAPQVMLPCSLEELPERLPEARVLLLPYEKGGRPLKEVLTNQSKIAETPVFFMIGPEGGFEEKEVSFAQTLGAITVTLGPRILRTETAGVALLAAVMYEWGDLGQ